MHGGALHPELSSSPAGPALRGPAHRHALLHLRGHRHAGEGPEGPREAGRPAAWTLIQPASCILAAQGLATAPEEVVVPRGSSISQEEAAQGKFAGRWTRPELLSKAPVGGSGGLSYPLLEHPAPCIETLSQLLVRNTVPPPRFIWLEGKNFTNLGNTSET